jgi:site-specific DNA-adenine methylase
LQNVIIDHVDWRKCIQAWDAPYETKGVVMYLDPPYPGNNCNYQHNMRGWEDHVELLARLRQLKAKFLLSTYDTPATRELCQGFAMLPVDFAAGMPTSKARRSRNRELLVANYDFHLPAPSDLQEALRTSGTRDMQASKHDTEERSIWPQQIGRTLLSVGGST